MSWASINLHYGDGGEMFKSKLFKKAIEGEPVILLTDGVINETNLNDMKITVDELEESIREHGFENHTKVKLAILEVDGNISVISTENNKFKQTQYKRKKMHRNLK